MLRDEPRAIACDRVLLYTRGLDVDPLRAVDLAREALRRAGPEADTADVMDALTAVLAEPAARDADASHALEATDGEGRPLCSWPPLNRRPMVPEDMALAPPLTVWRNRLKKLRAPEPPANPEAPDTPDNKDAP